MKFLLGIVVFIVSLWFVPLSYASDQESRNITSREAMKIATEYVKKTRPGILELDQVFTEVLRDCEKKMYVRIFGRSIRKYWVIGTYGEKKEIEDSFAIGLEMWIDPETGEIIKVQHFQ